MKKVINFNWSAIKNLNWILFSNIAFALTQFLTISFLSKMAGPEEVGVYTLGLAISSPLFLLLSLKLRNVLVTDYEDEHNFHEYRVLRLFTNLAAILLIACMLFWMEYDFSSEIVLLLFALNKSLEMYSDIYHGLYQKKQKMDLIGKSVIIRAFGNFMVFILVYSITSNLIWSLLSNTLIHLLVLCLMDLRFFRQFNLAKPVSMDFKKLKDIFILSLPLGISTAVGSLLVNVPRYFIEWHLDTYSLGVFAGISYLVISGNTLLNAISQVYLPKLSELAARNDMRGFWRTLLFIIGIGFILGLVLLITVLFFGSEILTLIFSSEYAKYTYLLSIMAAGTIFVYTSVFLGTAVTALKEFRLQPVMHFITLLIVAVISYFLIGKAGLNGAGWSVFASYLISSVGYICLLGIAIKKRRRMGHASVPAC